MDRTGSRERPVSTEGGGISRRRLLATGAAGAGALAIGGWAALSGRSESARVVVVGAGLAGLSAGFELERTGWDVVVLEARHRLGGRVLTLRFPGRQHAEAGGEFIDTEHDRIRSYCRRFGLELEDARRGFGDSASLVYRYGRRFIGPGFQTPAVRERVESAWRALAELGAGVDPERPASGVGARLDRLSAADFLDRPG